MATAAARNISPYTVPVGPRLRPPRLLPGTKAANTNPQPDEPPSTSGDVWVQGRWRNPKSNAAKDRRAVQSVQVEKALRHATHGMNIYAYTHIRTNQVVYSLTRIMQNNKILSQLLFHGKQTVPAQLRRDLWKPYFSIHFAQTPAGAEAGLQTYHYLRELSVLRQLSPPSELVIATEADVKKARRKYNPFELHDMEKDSKKTNMPIPDMPVENERLPKKFRAKRLMDQKASSVADTAFVLSLINKGLSPTERQDLIMRAREKRKDNLSKRATRRLNKIREQQAAKEAQIATRQENVLPSEGRLGLTPHSARRVALEYGGTVTAPWKGSEYTVTDIAALQNQAQQAIAHTPASDNLRPQPSGEQKAIEFDAESFRSEYVRMWQEQNATTEEPPSEDVKAAIKQERNRIRSQASNRDVASKDTTAVSEKKGRAESDNNASRTVQVLWADLRDATWAEQWSSNVYHGELDARAALKYERVVSRPQTTIDEQGDEIPGQVKKIVIQSSTTPHIFGNNAQDGSYETPDMMATKRQEWRESKLGEWKEQKLIKAREYLDRIDALSRQRSELIQQRVQLVAESEAEAAVERMTEAEKEELQISIKAMEERITTLTAETAELEQNYPTLYRQISEVLEWRTDVNTFTNLVQIERQIEDLRSAFDSEDPAASVQLRQIDGDLMVYAERHNDLENVRDAEQGLMSRLDGYRRKIQDLSERVGSLEPDSVSGAPTNDRRNLENLIVSDRSDTFNRRLEYIRTALDDLQQNDRLGGQVTDLLRQRQHLSQDDQTENVSSIDQELKEREDELFLAALGLDQPRPARTETTEYDESMRERGIEAPRPSKPRSAGGKGGKGIWARITSFFGR